MIKWRECSHSDFQRAISPAGIQRFTQHNNILYAIAINDTFEAIALESHHRNEIVYYVAYEEPEQLSLIKDDKL